MAFGKIAPPRAVTRCVDCPLKECKGVLPNTPDELEFIESLKQGERHLQPGDILIPEHSTSGELYTLLSGWGFRFKTLSDGRRQILNFLMPGDFIGLQQKMEVETANGVEMLTPAVACRFSRDALWKIFASHPVLAYDITWLAAHEESMVDDNLISAGRRSAAERVASFLIWIYRRALPLFGDEGRGVPFPINQQHISDALGLSLVHTNKTLRRLHHMGLYEIIEGRLRLLDVHALKTLGDVSVGIGMPPRRVL